VDALAGAVVADRADLLERALLSDELGLALHGAERVIEVVELLMRDPGAVADCQAVADGC
jgi:hypothetical protein